MEESKLIEEVIRKVLADPRIQQLFRGGVAADSKRPRLLLLLNYSEELQEILDKVLEKWGESHDIRVLGSSAVMDNQPELPDCVSWISYKEARDDFDWERIILPTCSASTLAKLALGIRDTEITKLAAEGICRGVALEVYTDRLGFTSKTPIAYRRLYEGYMKQLISYGVWVRERFGREEAGKELPLAGAPQVEPPVVGGSQPAPVAAEPAEIIWEARLLTDKDVYDFPTDSKVRVKKNAIITPLARDTLKRRRIELHREGEEQVCI